MLSRLAMTVSQVAHFSFCFYERLLLLLPTLPASVMLACGVKCPSFRAQSFAAFCVHCKSARAGTASILARQEVGARICFIKAEAWRETSAFHIGWRPL